MIGRSGGLLRVAVLLGGTPVAATIALQAQRALGAPSWALYVIAVVFALLLVIVSHALTLLFIHRRVGIDTREVAPGVQAWETTAGTGIVPRWVSLVGLFGICFALAIPFSLVAAMPR